MTDDIEIEHDTSLVEAVTERGLLTARAAARRELVRVILASGVAAFAVLAGATLVEMGARVQIASTEKIIQAPPAQVIEIPKLIEPTIIRPEIIRPEVAPRVAGEPERRPLADFPDRVLAGTIVSADTDQVCIRPPSGGAPGCVWPALVDANGKAILDARGEVQRDPAKEYGPMESAIGHEAYQAPSPSDPGRLSRYWWKQDNELVAFNVRLAHHASAPARGREVPIRPTPIVAGQGRPT